MVPEVGIPSTNELVLSEVEGGQALRLTQDMGFSCLL
jgi:hypothetical protein